jgi:hypothetical protein
MTDIRIVMPNGERHEVSNTYLTSQRDANASPNTVNGIVGSVMGLTSEEVAKGGVFNFGPSSPIHARGQAPSKKEVKTASGRSTRKNHNGKKALQRASRPPVPPSENISKPRPAYNPNDTEPSKAGRRKESSAPWNMDDPKFDVWRTW